MASISTVAMNARVVSGTTCAAARKASALPVGARAMGATPFVGQVRSQARSMAASTPRALSARPVCASAAPDAAFRSKDPSEVNVLVVGPTGYIGRVVTKQLVDRGYNVTAFAREKSGVGAKKGVEDVKADLEGVNCVFGDVMDLDSIQNTAFANKFDCVISCLASRTGGVEDSWKIDYQATKNVLDVARNNGTSHFVLLSAICAQKPLLEFQKAKLKLEADLAACDDITHSIVRPTAFFKSLAGQIESVKKGGPYVMFGDGTLAACKPISEVDLANFIIDCVQEEDKVNQMLPIGGPGKAYTAKEQADLLFGILDMEPKTLGVPVAIMDAVIGVLDFLKQFFPNLVDGAEFGRIGRYYATESMLVWDEKRQEYDADATPEYGEETLEMFFRNAVKEGGLKDQELGDAAVF